MRPSITDRAPRATGILLLAMAAVAAGCAAPQTHNLTFERGVRLLSSGSPASAIPVLSQVIASEPDGPEPHAMLAMAYALDGRRDLAVAHAAEARRRRSRDDPPGWEGVALAVVAMTQHEPEAAARRLAEVSARAPRPSPLGAAANRWLVLAQLQHGDCEAALQVLAAPQEGDALAGAQERATARLWAVLTRAYQGKWSEAGEVLAEVAGAARGRRPAPPAAGAEPPSTPRDLAAAGLDAASRRDFARARSAFAALHQKSPYAADAPVWLALIDGVQGNWNRLRDGLAAAADQGPLPSRGLAHHLLSVVAALEARPNDLVDHLLAGQRLLSKGHTRLPSPPPAQHERVWMSDRLD